MSDGKSIYDRWRGDSKYRPVRTPAEGSDATERDEVRVKPYSYQPSKAELEEPVKIDATPEELARALGRQVRVVKDEG